MKACRKTLWAVVAILATGAASPATADSRGTFYVLQMDPRGSERLDDPGWGLGSKVAIPLVSTREIVSVEAGYDAGSLESDTSEPSGLATGVATTQDYQRIFGGVEFGRKLDARIRPHVGVHAVVVKQEVKTIFVDAIGEPFAGSSDSNTRLSYDVSAGFGMGITHRTGLDAGVRYMDEIETKVPEPDGSFTTIRPDYLQFYLGVTHRFAWPQGH